MENKNVNETKEKMIKVFEKLGKATRIVKYMLVILLVTGISIGVLSNVGLELANESIMQAIDQMTGKVDESSNADAMETSEIVNGILATITVVVIAFIVDTLEKIFKNTVEKETPFTEENIKNLKKISIVSVIACVVCARALDLSFIYAIAICSIYYMFKYAYLLQQESDETL